MNKKMKYLDHNPPVSIILPVYNGEEFIEDAIESVLGQTYENWELIIINDGSTDNSEQIIKNFLSNNRLKYFENHGNKGISSTRNRGLKKSTGEYIAFLDQDDLWEKNKLEVSISHFNNKRDKLGLVYSEANILNCTEQSEIIRVSSGAPNGLPRKRFIEKLFLKNFIKSMSQVVISKKTFQEVGLFDERLSVADDWDLYLRLAGKFSFQKIPKVLTTIRRHGENTSDEKTLEMKRESLEIILPKCLELYPFLNKVLKVKKAKILYSMGRVYHDRGQYKKARGLYLDAVSNYKWLNLKLYLGYLASLLHVNV